jgi:protocatechuate 4,5-dioxygenase alpha chain
MFDGTQAQKEFALNRMCFSFNSVENRFSLRARQDAWPEVRPHRRQRAAVRSRSVLAMIEAGGNVYYLAKLAGIFGLNVQDIGAQQTGTSVDAFKAKLAAAGAADVAYDVRDRATARACESRHPHTGG